MRRAEWLVERPWRLIALVALVVALPLLAVGEVASRDARGRLEQREAAATVSAAQHAADLVASRVTALRDELVGISGSADLPDAIAAGGKAPQRLLDLYRSVLSSDFTRLFVVVGVSSSDTDMVVAQLPVTDTLPPLSDYMRIGPDVFAVPSASVIRVVVHASGPTGVAILAPARFGTGASPSMIVGEVPLTAIASWMTPLLVPGSDLFLLDERDRLMLRSSDPKPAPPLEFVTDPSTLATAVDRFAVARVPAVLCHHAASSDVGSRGRARSAPRGLGPCPRARDGAYRGERARPARRHARRRRG